MKDILEGSWNLHQGARENTNLMTWEPDKFRKVSRVQRSDFYASLKPLFLVQIRKTYISAIDIRQMNAPHRK